MASENISSLASDFPDLMPTIYPYYFAPQTHVIVASYLLIIGVLGTLGNGVILMMFLRFRALVSPTTLLLINLAVSDLGLILFTFPFAASSSFSGRWIFGPGGCQWYAFIGFLFGSSHIGTLTVLAMDRYTITCKTSLRGKLTYRRYFQIIAGVWTYALFWASVPLLGWGRYGPEPSITTCTIDWQHNDSSYKSFILVYFVLGYVVPLVIITACYCAISRSKRTHQSVNKRTKELAREHWTNERSVTMMSGILVLAFVIAWSPYAVVCLWPLFDEPITVPAFLTLLPPLIAKASTVFNPIIYFFSNPRLRAGIVATLFCAFHSTPPELINLGDNQETTPVATDGI